MASRFLKKALLLCLTTVVVSVISGPAIAQNLTLKGLKLQDNTGVAKTSGSDETKVRHFTQELLQSAEGQEAIRKYQQMKAGGKLPALRKGSNDPIGTVRNFEVQNTNNSSTIDTIEFIKKAEGPAFSLWVETAEIANGHVLDSDIANIAARAGESTANGSYDPSKGVVEINTEVFGPSPDVDGDGILDILLVDVRDGYPFSNSAVTGFFDPKNMTGLNNRDIVYLDTFPGIVDNDGIRGSFGDPAQTLAHEHQHLVFFEKNGGGDLSFVNEGLSEWAENVNGFIPRATPYLQIASERLKPLLNWRGNGDGDVIYDYQRAGRFTNYLAERIGTLEAGALSRSVALGYLNYTEALGKNGLELGQVVLDFHTANLLNDRSINPRFGFADPRYASFTIQSVPEIDGSAASSSPPTVGTLQPGAAFYMKWNEVADLQLDITGDFSRLSGHLVLESFTGIISVIPLDESDEGVFVSGSHATVTLVMTNTGFVDSGFTAYEFRSSWSVAEQGFVVEEIIYDNGLVGSVGSADVGGPFNIFQVDSDRLFANRFEVPAGASLSSVAIDHAYLSDDPGQGLNGQPRDFSLIIWDENETGTPGNVLFSLEVDDTSPDGFSTNLLFTNISLAAFSEDIGVLPAVIYVGSGNTGNDPNNISMIVSDFDGANSPSWIFNGSTWRTFTDPSIAVGSDTFQQSVLPIRARFLIPILPVGTDEPAELPEQVTLHQNYPNPFNPTTTIEFTLPDAGNVRLIVYDILGRQVATVVDEFRTVGLHQVSFDAGRFSSGLYLYALEAGGSKVTRTMTLLK
jgi:hypothetical protein